MTRPLRILFITDAYPPHAYGSGWSTYHLARGLRAQGHAVRIVLAHPTMHLEATTYDQFPVWQAPPNERALNPALFAMQGLGPGRIARSLVRRWQPDIIHAQHINSALVAHHISGKTPVIITVRDHWPICFYGTALAATGCPACLHGTLSVCNGRRGTDQAPRLAHLLKAETMRAMLAQRRRILRGAAAIIAASAAIADEVRTVSGAATVAQIPNAVDHSVVMTTDTSAIPDIPERFFLFAGKLSAHKGADMLPEIIAQLGDDAPPLLIVGDGEETPMLRAAESGGARLRVLGRVPNSAVIGLMHRAIALITPARWPEPLSRTHLEALAVGCPIVATDTGGTREIVVPGVTGYLTDVGDTVAMANHLRSLASDPALRASMVTASRARSAALFSLEAVTARHIAVYESAIAQKHGGGSL